MEILQLLVKDPLTSVLGALVFFYAIKELVKNWDWIKERLQGYAKKEVSRTDASRKAKEIEQTVNELTVTTEKQSQALERLEHSIESLNQTMIAGLAKLENDRKSDTRASLRATLLNLYEKLKDKETLELGEYETFSDVAERYVKAEGNGPFKNKIIPEILNKKQVG